MIIRFPSFRRLIQFQYHFSCDIISTIDHCLYVVVLIIFQSRFTFRYVLIQQHTFMNISCRQFDSTLWNFISSSLKVIVMSSSILVISWWSMHISYVSTSFRCISFYALSDAWYLSKITPKGGMWWKFCWRGSENSVPIFHRTDLKCIRLSLLSTVWFVNIRFAIVKR